MARHRALTLLFCALVLAGCAAHPASPKAKATLQPGSLASLLLRPTATATATATSGASGTSASGQSPSSSGPTQSSPGQTKSPGGHASPTPHTPPRQVKLVLSIKPCVQRGQTQVVSFHANPHMGVIVDTRYSDGKDGQQYGGIDYNHYTDAHGNYRFSWIVSPVAPLGPADTLAGAVDHTTQATGRATWRVAVTC